MTTPTNKKEAKQKAKKKKSRHFFILQLLDSNVTNARAVKVWMPAITQGQSRLVPKTSPQAAISIRSSTKLVTSYI